MQKQESVVSLTDREREVLEAVAALRGLPLEDAIVQLLREGILARFGRRRRASAQIHRLQRVVQ